MLDMSKPPTICPDCGSERVWDNTKGNKIPKAVCWSCGLLTPCHENAKPKPEEQKTSR